MAAAEPALARTRRGPTPYKGRWRWWYASICDYRLAHPGCTNREVAAFLKKNENTISAITNTDLYRDYEAQRKKAWREQHEGALRDKLIGVTTMALDSVAAQLKKKGDQVPLAIAKDLVETGLDRLGFGPQPAPSVIVNNQQVLMPAAVSPAALEEARNALRLIEQKKLAAPPPDTNLDDVLDGYAVEVVGEPQEEDGTSLGSQSGAETEEAGAGASIIDS